MTHQCILPKTNKIIECTAILPWFRCWNLQASKRLTIWFTADLNCLRNWAIRFSFVSQRVWLTLVPALRLKRLKLLKEMHCPEDGRQRYILLPALARKRYRSWSKLNLSWKLLLRIPNTMCILMDRTSLWYHHYGNRVQLSFRKLQEGFSNIRFWRLQYPLPLKKDCQTCWWV